MQRNQKIFLKRVVILDRLYRIIMQLECGLTLPSAPSDNFQWMFTKNRLLLYQTNGSKYLTFARFWMAILEHAFLGSVPKNSHKLMAGPLSRRLCQSISINNHLHYHHINFFLMAAAAILFLMDSSQKLIRSSEKPREQSYQI